MPMSVLTTFERSESPAGVISSETHHQKFHHLKHNWSTPDSDLRPQFLELDLDDLRRTCPWRNIATPAAGAGNFCADL